MKTLLLALLFPLSLSAQSDTLVATIKVYKSNNTYRYDYSKTRNISDVEIINVLAQMFEQSMNPQPLINVKPRRNEDD